MTTNDGREERLCPCKHSYVRTHARTYHTNKHTMCIRNFFSSRSLVFKGSLCLNFPSNVSFRFAVRTLIKSRSRERENRPATIHRGGETAECGLTKKNRRKRKRREEHMLLLLQVIEILHLFTVLSFFFEICLLPIRKSHSFAFVSIHFTVNSQLTV